jgi:hypothetical protein
MATVHSLEKLSRMLKSIEGDESLESAVASERLNSLLLRTQQVNLKRSYEFVSLFVCIIWTLDSSSAVISS